MCGITGWVYLRPEVISDTNRDELILRSMCDRIRHRGPDSEGVFLGHGAALGIRRLAVIDLATGSQPMSDESGSIVTVLNGEIYNFRELRAELENRGHLFRSSADTEVIPHLYEEYGDRLVEHLNGMFAFAVWDSRRKRLFIARDRLGEKPLYYCQTGEKLIFGSEIKTLLSHPDITAELDPEALRQYLAFDYVPAPQTIYKGIFKLPAGHRLTVENGRVTVEQYWTLDHHKPLPAPTIDAAADELEYLLDKSVQSRLVADVPIGVFLSGGVDSSVIAAVAARHTSGRLQTFCIGFEDSDYNESVSAKTIARHIGSDHHEARFSPEAASALVPDIARWLDEPLADPSIVPTFYLSRFARSMVTVALGGDGADELFGGYPTYYAHKMIERYLSLPKFIQKRVIRRFVRMMPHDTDESGLGFMGRRFLRAVEIEDPIARHFSFFGSFTAVEQEALLLDSDSIVKDTDLFAEPRRWARSCEFDSDIESNNIVETMQFLDMKLYLAEDILTKVDRASMAVSLEVRSPFLDRRIVEFAAHLPRNFKLKCNTARFAYGRTGKYILKKTAERLLPKEVGRRRKKGFMIPSATWINGELRPLVGDMLSPQRIKNQGIFDPKYVQRLVNEHRIGRANHAKKIWSLMMFEFWHEKWLASGKAAASEESTDVKAAA